MIYTCRFDDPKLITDRWDVKYMIVRSYRSHRAGFKHLPVLSPSSDLFYEYRALYDAHAWNKDSFNKTYVPKFLKEMHEQNAMDMLNTIYAMSFTNNIALCCYCKDESLCHRSIIAGLLQGAGAPVQTSSGKDYSKYWDMYNMPLQLMSALEK